MDKPINQEETPLLSVVVLAYNIEKELLDRCISSVVQQTYTHIEIILINNASKDDTGKYCDEWSLKDQRIHVYHNQQGQYARELLEHTTGEYIHILDHDDWIAPNMYENMMSALVSTNSDIARCEYCFAYPDGRIVQRNVTHHTDEHEIMGRKEAVLLLLENKKWQGYFWVNIYKKQIWDHFEIPKIKAFGDVSTVHTLYHRASQIVYLHDVFYYYYQRPGSEINQIDREGKKYRDYLRSNSIYLRFLFAKQYPEYQSILPLLKKEATADSLFSLWDIIDYPHIFPENAYGDQVERLKQFSFSLRDGKYFVLNFDLFLLKIIPRCYKFFYKLVYRNLRRIPVFKNFGLKK